MSKILTAAHKVRHGLTPRYLSQQMNLLYSPLAACARDFMHTVYSAQMLFPSPSLFRSQCQFGHPCDKWSCDGRDLAAAWGCRWLYGAPLHQARAGSFPWGNTSGDPFLLTQSSDHPGVGVKSKLSVSEALFWASRSLGCVWGGGWVGVQGVIPDSPHPCTYSLNWLSLGCEQKTPSSGCAPFLARQGQPGRRPHLTFRGRASGPTLIPWPSFLALESFLGTRFRAAPLRP